MLEAKNTAPVRSWPQLAHKRERNAPMRGIPDHWHEMARRSI
jgi:hypothetical protein